MLEELLNYLSSAFVFIPLIILTLFILIKTYLKIQKWTYDRKMDGALKWHKFPPFYPFKLLGRYVLIPILKVLFEILKGVFTAIKNNKFKTIIILICAAIIGSGMYIYTTKPDYFLKYSQTLTRLFIFFSFIALMFVVITQLSQGYESNSDGSEDYMPKAFKMVGQSKSYLYWTIIMGLLIAFLGFIVNLLGSSEIFTLTATSLIMLIAGVGCLFMLYSLGKNIFKKQLKDNPWFNILYHSIFIIPCILIETTEYLYREFKTTPQIVYKALALEIVVVFIWYIMPMITEYLYTYSTSQNNKAASFKNQITSIENGISKMDARMSKIKSNAPYSLSDDKWEQIRINGYWQESEKTNLVKYLKDAGFEDSETNVVGKNSEMVKYIMNQGNGREYDMLYSSKEKGNKQIEELNKALNNVATLESSKFLLKKAVYLNKETRINPLNKDFHLGFGVDDKTYNYSISFWVFLHNNNPQIAAGDNNYKNILNYDERPKIAYNILENALRIYVRKEGGTLVTLYTKRNFKLQKWHNIVINYTGGVLDVFLNAKLVATQSKVIPKMNIPNLLLGENKGVQGGITNILYFPTFMSRTRIETNYRLLRDNPQKMS
jgi:hypothetical protein